MGKPKEYKKVQPPDNHDGTPANDDVNRGRWNGPSEDPHKGHFTDCPAGDDDSLDPGPVL
jgi:hypothetical protein